MVSEKSTDSVTFDDSPIENHHPLYLIVGDRSKSPCDHATFRRFQLWVVENLTKGKVDNYQEGIVSIAHWDEQAGEQYPYLLNPCECGTYLPMQVDPNPMFSSSIGLLAEMRQMVETNINIPQEYRNLVDSMIAMSEHGIATNAALEIR